MFHRYFSFLVLSCSLLLLSACGSSDSNPPVEENASPVAVISGAEEVNVKVGDTLTLNGINSTDKEDGTVTSYLWESALLSSVVTSDTVTLDFTSTGDKTVTLTVTDSDGATNSKTITFTVTPIDSTKPSAVISPSTAQTITVGETLTLSGASSTGENLTYLWSNGSTESSVDLTYTDAGTVDVTLTVTDSDGATSTKSIAITVVPVGTVKPIAVISPSTAQTINVGESITLSATDSTGENLTYLWSNDSTDNSVELTYTEAGTVDVTLTVTDSDGATSTASITLTVVPIGTVKPVAVISPSAAQTIKIGESLTLSATDSTGEGLTYLWSNGSTDSSVDLTYTKAGTVDVTLTVTDTNGETNTATVSIIVEKDVKPEPTSTIIYFKNTDNYNPVHIHYFDMVPDTVTDSAWLAESMTDLGSDWYSYDFGSIVTSGMVLFAEKTGVQSEDLPFDASKPCYQDKSWVDMDNCGVNALLDPDFDNKAPTVTVDPAAGSYPDNTSLSVTLLISDNKDTNPTAYYTIDGSKASANSTPYTGPITIDDNVVTGIDVTLDVFVIDAKGNEASYSYDYRLNEDYVLEEKPDAMQLGAVYTAAATTFRIWSPDSSNVKVTVNGTEHSLSKVSDFDGYSNVYEVVVDGDLHLAEYTFSVNGNDVRDPYGKMVKPKSNTNVVMNMALTDVDGGWSPRPELIKREDAVIYEVHVRAFTLDESSGVPDELRGKYLGMVEDGTTLLENGVSDASIKTGIAHLKELGVTHIQLMPVYDFGTCDGDKNCFNWGYDPINYNVPEDTYSQYAGDEYLARANEFKTMINEFHKAGFRVNMDVVYNHTYDDNQVFDGITGSYYHSFGDMSGCGNSIDASVPMVSRMIQDSLDYWVNEYNIDGFRFDLIGIFTHVEVAKWGEHINAKYPERNILLYGEPWSGYYDGPDSEKALRVRYNTTSNLVEEHVGVFNGEFREAIKGKNDKPACAWMCNDMGGEKVDGGSSIVDGLKGSPKDPSGNNGGEWGRSYTKDPEQTINYISAHDNYGLWDKVYLATAADVAQVSGSNHQLTRLTPPSDLNRSKKIVNFGMGIVLTSQGIPFMYAGDEFLRTKTNNGDMANVSAWNSGSDGGAHNTYNLPDSWNKIRWNWKVENAATFKYFKDIIEIRKNHSGLRMNTEQEIAQYLDVQMVDSGGHLITAHSTYPSDDELFIVLNNNDNTNVSLPAGSWTQIADATGATNVAGKSGSVSVEGTAVTIFKKD